MDLEKKVLVGIELNFETRLILAAAASFFRNSPAKFFILYCVQPDPVPFINRNSKSRLNEGDIKDEMEKRIKDAGLYYLNCEIVLVHGAPAMEILDFSRKKGIDLIVLGTHQKAPVRELITGSVSLNVVKHSICPVLLLPLKSTVKSSAEEFVKENVMATPN